MSEDPHRERIPLPPILLSVVPLAAMAVGLAIAVWAFPGRGPWAAFVGAAVGFILPLPWIAMRVRRDDR